MKQTFLILTILFTRLALMSQGFPGSPDSAVLHTEDIALFWKVFDEAKPDMDAYKFKSGYLDRGSAGLRGFIPMRIESGKNLSKVIRNDVSYYENIRATSFEVDKNKSQLMAYLHAMEKLYPAAVFPDVYFVIGARNSGGTTFRQGLIIGAEMFGNETPSFKPRLPFGSLNLVVVHELVHFQQNYTPDRTLLGQCLKEGAADFVTELVTGSHANQYFYAYGDAHEQALWLEFREKMNGTDWTPWLYYNKDKSRPADLGYWMGYKICKAYYDKAVDKQQAVVDILNIKDAKAFLAASGYTPH